MLNLIFKSNANKTTKTATPSLGRRTTSRYGKIGTIFNNASYFAVDRNVSTGRFTAKK